MPKEAKNIHIYLAGPDFPHIDTRWIDELETLLQDEGYIPHRPIKENGLFTGNETDEEQQLIFEKDVELLEQADMLIAVMINDDPGTYVEVGWVAKAGKPVILFDPDHRVRNLFLARSADAVVHSIEEMSNIVQNLLNSHD